MMPPAPVSEIEEEAPFRFYETTATRKVFELDKRIRAVAGGTAASKTISILIWLIKYSQVKRNKIVDVVSESYPHLEAGAILDFQRIMKAHNVWIRASWNDTKHQYTFETGTVLRFRSLELSSAHGPRRDVLYINEANNIPLAVYDQLEPRTREVVWLDWNPSVEFWFYTVLLTNPEIEKSIDFITLTYLDNEALDQSTVTSIESRKANKIWWQVYGLGQLGEVEGRIYTGWRILDEIPFEARLMRRGLDFGFSQDPAALVDIYYYNGGYILDEQLYQKFMHNKPIADFIKNLPVPQTLVIADSAEPKSIDELRLNGISVLESLKGGGSVNKGIDYIQDQRMSITSRSIHGIHEYRTYLWKVDRDGRIIKTPEDGNDHFLDAMRYAMESLHVQEEDDDDDPPTSGNLSKMWATNPESKGSGTI